MLVFLISGAIAGILLGIRFKVLVVVPASLLAAVIVVANGSGQQLGAVVLTLLGTVASLQIGYVVGSILRALVRTRLPAAERHKRDGFTFRRFFHD
jgi:tetrahydromethanopterin S-methyltransferase subunit C